MSLWTKNDQGSNPTTSKGYPDRKHIYSVFHLFNEPPDGVRKFFDEHVDENVHFIVTGQHRFSGTWNNKAEYFNATWAKIDSLLAPPGFRMEVPGGEEGIILDQDGWCALEMQTVDMKTKGGVPYEQHYSWHVRWNKQGKIVEVKAFLDADHLEKVLGGEQKRLGLVA